MFRPFPQYSHIYDVTGATAAVVMVFTLAAVVEESSLSQRFFRCVPRIPGDPWIYSCNGYFCRSQWPRGLRRRSATARLLRLWVRIPTGGMDVCLLWVLCVVRQRSLRRADHSSSGVLPTVISRCVWFGKPQEWGGHGPRWAAVPQEKLILLGLLIFN